MMRIDSVPAGTTKALVELILALLPEEKRTSGMVYSQTDSWSWRGSSRGKRQNALSGSSYSLRPGIVTLWPSDALFSTSPSTVEDAFWCTLPAYLSCKLGETCPSGFVTMRTVPCQMGPPDVVWLMRL